MLISAAMWALVFSAQNLGLATCRARFRACAVGAARARFLCKGRGLWVWWVGGVPRVGMKGFVVQSFVAFLVLLLFHHMFKVRIFVLECNVLRPDCNPACRFRDDYLPTLRECGRLAIIGYHESVGCGSGVEEYFHVFLVFSLVSGPCVLS